MSKIQLRSLNNTGVSKFSDYISEAKEAEKLGTKPPALPILILTNPDYLDPIIYNKDIDDSIIFTSRYDLGEYLRSELGDDFLKNHYSSFGIWSWLALLWFKQIQPPSKDTNRHEHFIPYEWYKNPSDYFKGSRKLGYRHAVRGPYEAVCMLGDDAKFFLSKNIANLGDATEQLLSTRKIISSTKLRELLIIKYSDSKGNMVRNALDFAPPVGRPNPKRKGYGKIRRLVRDVLPRVKVTYDIDDMKIGSIVVACGDEFQARMVATKKLKRKR